MKHKFQQNYSKRKVIKLANGFRKPDTDFYLLTSYYCMQQPSSLRLGDVIVLGMECVGVKRFLCFSRRREHELARKVFSGFRRKHLIITTHVEKQCTLALKGN